MTARSVWRWMTWLAIGTTSCAGVLAQEEDAANADEVEGLELDGASAYKWRLEVVEENDIGSWSPFADDQDEHYTQGLMIAATWETPGLLDRAPWLGDGLTLGAGAFDRVAVGAQVRHQIFTPVEIDAFDAIPNDRPFTGLLLLGGHIQRRNDTVLDHAEVLVGATGDASGAPYIQSQWHQALSFRPINGWRNQVEDRFIIQSAIRRDVRRRRALGEEAVEDGGWAWDAIGSVGQDLGTFQVITRADATVRIGRHLRDDFGPSRVGVLGAHINGSGYTDTDRGWWPEDWGFSAFSRVGVRYVLWDISLDGHADFGVPSVNPREWFGEIAYGFEFEPTDWIRVSWQETHQSETFVEQAGNHRFVTLSLLLSFKH